jgi:hypothetical protein
MGWVGEIIIYDILYGGDHMFFKKINIFLYYFDILILKIYFKK